MGSFFSRPQMVLKWDFREYKVCEDARQFLMNVFLRPLICVSAVNPLLFEKVRGWLTV